MGNITIFAGGFGSGKSEIALNYALDLSRTCHKVVLADIDLVNPFFCPRELSEVILEHGVKLIAPIEQLRFGDVPQVPAEVVGYLGMENEMIIDVGGDEVGSWVLGYLQGYMKARPYQMLLVINPYRPFAENLEGVRALRGSLENASRLRFAGIVSNPNLAAGTDLEVVLSGHERVKEYARELGLPIKFLAVEEDIYALVAGEVLDVDTKPLKLYLRPEWL